MEIKPLQFEIMIDRLEKASSNQVLYLVKMSPVLKLIQLATLFCIFFRPECFVLYCLLNFPRISIYSIPWTEYLSEFLWIEVWRVLFWRFFLFGYKNNTSCNAIQHLDPFQRLNLLGCISEADNSYQSRLSCSHLLRYLLSFYMYF